MVFFVTNQCFFFVLGNYAHTLCWGGGIRGGAHKQNRERNCKVYCGLNNEKRKRLTHKALQSSSHVTLENTDAIFKANLQNLMTGLRFTGDLWKKHKRSGTLKKGTCCFPQTHNTCTNTWNTG